MASRRRFLKSFRKKGNDPQSGAIHLDRTGKVSLFLDRGRAEDWPMSDVPSEPLIDWEVRSRDEQDKRIASAADPLDVDQLGDTVRIDRAPRAEAPQREMLQQPWLLD
jgi:hypothetical protein